ncbi:MAG: NADP oxidoreductase [Motiliproteus sp.]
MDKVRIATCSLAGCFGCHMSLLDIDEKLLDLVELVQFDRSPLTDIKHCQPCDVGFIEGGLCNQENVEVLLEFRRQCRILVAVGACAITGGVPAMRNGIDVRECLAEAYLDGSGIVNPQIPDDPELPLLLDKVRPIQDAVDIDYFLPGCPPSAEIIWEFITQLLAGKQPQLSQTSIRFD